MSINVVVVEKDPRSRDVLSQLLHAAPGFECLGAFECCDYLLDNFEPTLPDVVVVDAGLPLRSVEGSARRIKFRYPDVEILLRVSSAEERVVTDAFWAGASGYVFKNASQEEFLSAIRNVRAGGAAISRSFARTMLEAFEKFGETLHHDYHLTPSEHEILKAIGDGVSYESIADEHAISLDIVRSHMKHIYDKLHLYPKSGAVAEALREHLS